jgi:hypothetical protein
MLVKILLLVFLGFVASVSTSIAGEQSYRPVDRPVTWIGWGTPESLPPWFRNHCGADWWHGPYCADHCGAGYQFYYCSNVAFGCCHLGLGYCDWQGSLRCAPGL